MGVVTGDDDKPAVGLTASEQALLAREVAADKYAGCYSQTDRRRAFIDGWDAALEWVKEQGEQTKLQQPPITR